MYNGYMRKKAKQLKFTCVNCENVFYKPEHRLKYDKNLFCSRKCQYNYCQGENHPNYKGGNININGYKRVKIKGKDILEHRLVMEKHIGRKLKKNEHIHHIDKNKLNNSIENLQIVTNAEHHSIHMIENINNGSNIRGVSFDKERNRWFARISYKKKNIALGRYKSREEAIKARRNAERKFGYITSQSI